MTATLHATAEPTTVDPAEIAETINLSAAVHISTSAFALQEKVAGSLICSHGVTVYVGHVCNPCRRPGS